MHSGWNRVLVVLASCLAASVSAGDKLAPPDQLQRYIVEFHDSALAAYAGGKLALPLQSSQPERLEATSPAVTGARKLDVRSPQSRAYLDYLDQTHALFKVQAARLLGRSIQPDAVYRYALNGMALDLTASEAAGLASSPMVKSVRKDTRQRLHTDAGPKWIGAAEIWSGQSGFAANRGEGMVIGIIDSGINWDHPSFDDPATDGYHHVNPQGSGLGLCSDPAVSCNNKLIGVYDFIEDDPGTDEVEENTNGKDNSGHGSHVASIAAGDPVNVTFAGGVTTDISGVAPRANIIAYRVCYVGDPPAADGGGCMGSAILLAIDQAIADGVDVINYSIGTDAFNPWSPGSIPMAYLNARNAGIFVATSAGNSGPNASTVGSPGNAPWMFSVGNATHDRVFASIVQGLSGGSTTPPGDLTGAGLGGGLVARKIVHARDYGFALCGTGTAELKSSCSGNLGLSNPWKGSTPFSGEIVVCDRGEYGRVEKGKNVLLAGASGFILANTSGDGDSIVADEHCLPASHIGATDGDKLRAWLATGTGHRGAISGFTLVRDDKFADQVNASSSRGPATSPVQNILKPNVIAPGTSILGASDTDQDLLILTGTSMSSPHMAGAAALVRAVHTDWSVAQVASALETTATAELAKDHHGTVATPHERGAGRPRLGEAVNAGLFLDVSGAQFSSANPAAGGDPGSLNLSSLVDASCQGSCSFSRTFTDQMGGGNWTATAINFPAGVQVVITPATFTLANHAAKTVSVSVNLLPSGIVGEWVYGEIRLTAAGSSDQVLTVAVYSSGGDLPDEWLITDKRDTGWKEFSLGNLTAMPDATFTSGGLVPKTRTTRTLKQDPTASSPQAEKGHLLAAEDPFDGGEGVFTVWHNLPQGGLWLHAETLASTAQDLDLFVGRDDDGDGAASEEEQICTSSSPTDLENCDLFNIPAGNYWVVVQNWDGTVASGDEVTLVSAAVESGNQASLIATGPGKVAANANFTVRASWRDVNATSGEEWLGAVGVGTRSDKPNNIGVIPVYFNRNGYDAPQTLPLMNGSTHRIGLGANAMHDRMFIDVPDGVTSLNVAAHGEGSSQNNALKVELFRQDFNVALGSPPFAQLPSGLALTGTASGSGGNGPSITLNGSVPAGRYFVKLTNTSASAASATVTATANSVPSTLSPHRGLWSFNRGISQGVEWNSAGENDFLLWYTYDDAGQPTWYIASGLAATGNIWTADLLRVTNDGGKQQENIVGEVSVTFIADDQMVFSYAVLGQSGFDALRPLGPNTCPVISGGPKSYTGAWYRGVAGLGGASIVVSQSAQAQVHYLYDASGEPRWIIAADDSNQSATAEEIPLLQFKGFCAACPSTAISSDTIGTVKRTFTNQTAGKWTLNFSLDSPLVQTINRTDNIVKLSDTLDCE
ncbi:MAG: hypothetical protein EXR85_01225 [Xanthomonadales bacterium]|nr:hypothetical protein [Xanthomonadales bacterium]